MMFGHVDRYEHWARHLLKIRTLQAETEGFTEFVLLPFVAEEAPIYLKGRARRGPTFRETLLAHAVARLVLSPLIPNIQCSWVKLGHEGVAAALQLLASDVVADWWALSDELLLRFGDGFEHGFGDDGAWASTPLVYPAAWLEGVGFFRGSPSKDAPRPPPDTVEWTVDMKVAHRAARRGVK